MKTKEEAAAIAQAQEEFSSGLDLRELEGGKSSTPQIDTRRGRGELWDEKDIKQINSELKELNQAVDKIIYKTTARYLKKDVVASKQKLKEHEANGSSGAKKLENTRLVATRIQEEENEESTPIKLGGHGGDSPSKLKLPSAGARPPSDATRLSGNEKKPEDASRNSIVKGAIRYSSNLPLMLFNQMKQSKVITGKREKEGER